MAVFQPSSPQQVSLVYSGSYGGIVDNIRRRRRDRKERRAERKVDSYQKCVDKYGKNNSKCKKILAKAQKSQAKADKLSAKLTLKGKTSGTSTVKRTISPLSPKTLTQGASGSSSHTLTSGGGSGMSVPEATGLTSGGSAALYSDDGYYYDETTGEYVEADGGPNYLLWAVGGIAAVAVSWLVYTKVIKKPRATIAA